MQKVFVVCSLALILVPPSTSIPQTAADEEAALRALVEKFFVAYAKKDVDGFMSLWSEKSPDHASRKQSMQRQFVANEYAFGNLTFSRANVAGEKATLRVTVDITTVIVQTKQTGKERLIRNFTFMKEEGAWKVVRESSAVEDLVAALVVAKSGEEQKALLMEEKELVTAKLVGVLNGRGWGFFAQRNYSQALTILRLAQGIAEQIGDKWGGAFALRYIGNVYDEQDNYDAAMESYQKALSLWEEAGQPPFNTLRYIGRIHRLQGNYAHALEFLQKSLRIQDLANKDLANKDASFCRRSQADIAATLHEIGIVQELQGNARRDADNSVEGGGLALAMGHSPLHTFASAVWIYNCSSFTKGGFASNRDGDANA